MTKPTLESLEARLAPTTLPAILHAVGEDYQLQGTTLYQRDVGPNGKAGPWSQSLTGVQTFLLADHGLVANALLNDGQLLSSVHTGQVNTSWRLSLINVKDLTYLHGVTTATLDTDEPRYNDYRLGPGTPWEQALSAPLQTWEVDWAGYTHAQRQLIQAKVRLALSRLPAHASDFSKAAALTSFVHQWVHRKGGQDTQDGYDVLVSRYAVCGGMTVTLAEMLLAAGIPSQHFFELGGTNPAHSMLEAQFRDGTRGILDPYYGVVYYDLKLQRPVGVADLPHYLASRAPCTLICKQGNYGSVPAHDPPLRPMQTLLGSYRVATSDAHDNFSYPAVFTHSAQWHLAYDGLPVIVNVPLKPGSLLGRTTWHPSAREPKPWSDLDSTTLDGGESLSWAYVLGSNGGVQVQHVYNLSHLIVGKQYRLTLAVANAGTLPDLAPTPAVTLQGAGQSEVSTLQPAFWQTGQPYQPQAVTLDFTAQARTATVQGSALGNLVLAGIDLQAHPTAVVVTPPAAQWASEGGSVHLSVRARDGEGKSLTYRALGLPPGLGINASTGAISGTPTGQAVGRYTVTVIASDGASSDAATFRWAVADRTIPVIAVPATQQGYEGGRVRLALHARDADGDTLRYGGRYLPQGLHINPVTGLIYGRLSGNSGGVWTPQIWVSDGSHSRIVSFRWLVADVTTPTITAPPSQQGNEGDSVYLPVTALDADGDPRGYYASNLPPGLSINPRTGVISGTMEGQSAGTYLVTLFASDGVNTGHTTFTWVVADATAPSVTAPADQSSHTGDTVSGVFVTASDADGDTLTYSAGNLPPGLRINPTTGEIGGTLSGQSAGRYTVTVTASDGSNSHNVAFNWTVT